MIVIKRHRTRSCDCDCPPFWAEALVVVGSVAISASILALCGLGALVRLT